MAKRIRVSADDVTYYTLPGNAGQLSTEMASNDDTIFGQDYQSNMPSIGNWTIGGQAFYKGVAGYSAVLRKGGTPTAVVGEAMTQIGATKTYQVTAAARRMIAMGVAVNVLDNGVNQNAEVQSIDYLNGRVTFKSAYTVTGPVTLTYSYLPLAVIGKARSFNLTQQAAEIDTTDYETAQANNGLRTYDYGLKTVALEIGKIHDPTNDFIAALLARADIYMDVSPDATQGNATLETLFRGIFKYTQQSQQGNVGALEEETLNLDLYVPSNDLLEAPFKWTFGSASAVSPAVKVAINSWQNKTPIWVEYSPNGINGVSGQAIVTEASLANTYEGLNEFTFTFRGSGALTPL